MIIVESRELETLRWRLGERDVTLAEVYRWLELNHAPPHGMAQQRFQDFINEQALANFWWLHDWWDPVRDKPTNLPTPSIIALCWNVNHAFNAPPVTFQAAIEQTYNRCIAYCQQADLDPANPGESAEDRRRRRQRERMAKVREHRPVSKKHVKDPAVLEQVRSLEAQCDRLKDEAKAEDERLAEEVKQHQQRMQQAADLRKTTKDSFKAQVDGLRQQIKLLTQKQ